MEINSKYASIITASWVVLVFFAFLSIPKVHAAGAFSLSPTSGNFVQNCQFSIGIVATITSNQSNAADVILTYDTTKIEIIDALPSIPGIQIKPGNAYEVYVGNTVDTLTGTIKLVGYSTDSSLTGTATFATIYARPKALATNGALQFTFTGANPYNTTDSNIADAATSYDMLTSVTNAAYTFSAGSCTNDVTPPTITFVSPTNLSNNVPANSPFVIDIQDLESGVLLDSVTITINGIVYTQTSPEFTYTGTPSKYKITITPTTPLPTNTATAVTVSASDGKGNKKTSTMIVNAQFSCPPAKTITVDKDTPTNCVPTATDTTSPIITINFPAPESNIKEQKEISITATDETALALESFKFTLGTTVYSMPITPQAISVSGNKKNYTFVVTLDQSGLKTLSQSMISGYISISDLAGNQKTQSVSYKLAGDGQPTIIPAKSSTNFSVYLGTGLLLTLICLLPFLGISTAPIIGVVIDASTRKRIPFAHIYVADKQGKMIVSNIFGNIRLRLNDGQHYITAQKYAYEQKSLIVTVNNKQVKTSIVVELKHL